MTTRTMRNVAGETLGEGIDVDDSTLYHATRPYELDIHQTGRVCTIYVLVPDTRARRAAFVGTFNVGVGDLMNADSRVDLSMSPWA